MSAPTDPHQLVRTYNGTQPRLGQAVYIDPAASVIGDVALGDDVSVWPGAVIRGDVNRIRVGRRASIQDNAVLHVTHKRPNLPEGWPLLVGDDVTVGHQVTLHGCRVGNRVLVGIGAIILDGAVIEDEVMLGAGTLVPPGKVLASGYLYVGSPCKKARPLTDSEREFLPYSAAHYVKVKNNYLQGNY